MWESPKTQIMTKHKSSNFDKTQNTNCGKTQNSFMTHFKKPFVRTI